MENPAPTCRVYRLKWWQLAFALFFLTFGGVFTTIAWGGPIIGQAAAQPMLMTVAIVFVAVGLGLTLSSFKSRVTFTADAIESRTLFRQESLPLHAIRGRREYVVRNPKGGSTKHLKLVPNDDRLPTLDFLKYYTFDDVFFNWFYALPDLDAEDKKRLKDSDFGLV